MTDSDRTADAIALAERTVGPVLEQELAGHLDLARDLTNLAGSLVEQIQNAPGEARALHVCAFLLSRLITDLQACALLVRNGYAGQALALTAGMLEIAHTSMYIGANEDRAQQWLAHADLKKSSPWPLRQTIHAVAQEMGVPASVATREYESIYKQACMAKHGHPIALGTVGIVSDEDSTYVVAGPYLSESVRRWSHVAILHGIRYTKLAAIKFVGDHLRGTTRGDNVATELNRLADLQQMLAHADATEFGLRKPN